ncbi:electron transfer flavoprotein subunit beta/FixA family protein [Leucobacter albus]|uniref:Electron transfer flavoprotein subunit beta/FixA family protein n=1 Tax=Leucobacter albus TaxID=272210 RepID=A0ABW3TN42_9MICO
MKIVVLVKEVPDTYGERTLSLETGLAERAAGEAVLDEICERALEVALSQASAEPAEVVVLAAGPEGATASIRKALAMGADRAIHIVDDGLRGADIGLTAEALAAALREEAPDLVLAGNQSTDGASGMLPAMLAELLGLPLLGGLGAVEVTAERAKGTRAADGLTEEVTATLPAVITVTEQLPEARFPNFKGIMAAKKKPLRVRSLAELGVDGDPSLAPRTIMLDISERPARDAGVRVVDDGTAVAQLIEFLTANRLV